MALGRIEEATDNKGVPNWPSTQRSADDRAFTGTYHIALNGGGVDEQPCPGERAKFVVRG